jgi:hypothetical protein
MQTPDCAALHPGQVCSAKIPALPLSAAVADFALEAEDVARLGEGAMKDLASHLERSTFKSSEQLFDAEALARG